jgi:hypothetical protein
MWSLVSLALLLIRAMPAPAEERAPAGWNPDEGQVLRNTAAGLPTKFDEKAPGILRPVFLQKLLTGRLEESRDARYILIRSVHVPGDLDLSHQEVKPYVSLKKFTFKGDVDFSWSSFAKGLNLSSGDFEKNVTFRGLEAKGPFRGLGIKFSGEEEVDLSDLKVDHIVKFSGAVFRSEANFAFSRVGDIDCEEAVFHEKARFDYVRIEGYANFTDTIFDGPVWFQNSYVGGSFELDGTCFNQKRVPEDRRIDMTNLVIKGTLKFTPKKWPTQGIHQSGIQYASWEPHNLTLELVERAEFDPQVYTNLENILRSTGRVADADRVGMAKKREERGKLKWWDVSYWWSVLLYLFVGNGYHPEWALIWSILIVLFGVLLFQRRRMIPQTRDGEPVPTDGEERHPSRRYSPIWYSLDLFVPAVNLETAQFWMPARDERFLLFWMRIQRILGWIIVPVGLLVISGIVKP